jgi:hypothetical protein
MQGMGCYHFLLEFSLFLSFFQEKERKSTKDKKLKNF